MKYLKFSLLCLLPGCCWAVSEEKTSRNVVWIMVAFIIFCVMAYSACRFDVNKDEISVCTIIVGILGILSLVFAFFA